MARKKGLKKPKAKSSVKRMEPKAARPLTGSALVEAMAKASAAQRKAAARP